MMNGPDPQFKRQKTLSFGRGSLCGKFDLGLLFSHKRTGFAVQMSARKGHREHLVDASTAITHNP